MPERLPRPFTVFDLVLLSHLLKDGDWLPLVAIQTGYPTSQNDRRSSTAELQTWIDDGGPALASVARCRWRQTTAELAAASAKYLQVRVCSQRWSTKIDGTGDVLGDGSRECNPVLVVSELPERRGYFYAGPTAWCCWLYVIFADLPEPEEHGRDTEEVVIAGGGEVVLGGGGAEVLGTGAGTEGREGRLGCGICRCDRVRKGRPSGAYCRVPDRYVLCNRSGS